MDYERIRPIYPANPNHVAFPIPIVQKNAIIAMIIREAGES